MAIKNGTAGADTLIGTTLADQLFGKGGNDILKGLAGPDKLDGGEGTDTADYSGSANGVFINLSVGLSKGGDAEGDTFVSIENVTGTAFGDVLAGDSVANRLSGGLGDDTLVGGGGNDTLLGGGGDDRFQGGAGIELIAGGGGRDLLTYSDSVLGVNGNLSTGKGTGGNAAGDTISGVEDLIGSADNDILAGSTSANLLSGFKGADQLFGFAGNDLMFGGEGADTMTGGAGADTFEFDFVDHSPAGFSTRDVIQDFSHAQGDVLDLSFIDASPENQNINTFEFLGKDALVDAPGQITYTFEGNTTVVQINTAGGLNSPPEMEIQLQGQIDLVASDFIL